MKNYSDRLPKALFIFSLIVFAYAYGLVTEMYRIFPYTYVHQALNFAFSLKNKEQNNWWHKRTNEKKLVTTYDKNNSYNGLTFLTYVNQNNIPAAKIINMKGQVVHEWELDWFKIWPNPEHLPSEDIPKEKPGTHIHGAVVLDNGDLIFNYESLGLVRVNKAGKVVWKLAYKTHHSIYQDEAGDLWVCGEIKRKKNRKDYPGLLPPFLEPTILKIDVDGKLKLELSVLDILKKNKLKGLVYTPTTSNFNIKLLGDIIHLNDVEIFPTNLPEDVFKHGDIMISLRNLNTILVIDPSTLMVKYKSIGHYIRQHDPDFVSANEISVFDNNNIAPDSAGVFSRIVIEDVKNGEQKVVFETQLPFYSKILGKHQWLPNGNLLIADAMNGRVIEYSKKHGVVWVYNNIIEEGKISIIEQATRLMIEPSVFTN